MGDWKTAILSVPYVLLIVFWIAYESVIMSTVSDPRQLDPEHGYIYPYQPKNVVAYITQKEKDTLKWTLGGVLASGVLCAFAFIWNGGFPTRKDK